MQQHRDPLFELDEFDDLDEVQRSFAPLVRVVDGVYDDDECAALIARIEALGPSFAPVTTSRAT